MSQDFLNYWLRKYGSNTRFSHSSLLLSVTMTCSSYCNSSEKSNMNLITLILATVLSLAFTQVTAQDYIHTQVTAQDYMKGYGALVAGDYATALKVYKHLAEQGHPYAQNDLGVLHLNGYGVLKDNLRTHMWYNIASANGAVGSGHNRDLIAAVMTPAGIEKAMAMARECMNSNYKKCGW